MENIIRRLVQLVAVISVILFFQLPAQAEIIKNIVSYDSEDTYSEILTYRDDSVPGEWYCDTVDLDGIGHNFYKNITKKTQEKNRNYGDFYWSQYVSKNYAL